MRLLAAYTVARDAIRDRTEMADPARTSLAVLNSWKEIATYLGRGVRTVQRWEGQLRLPVHRAGRGKRSPVYAFVPELKFWLVTVGFKESNKKSESNAGAVTPMSRRPRTAGAVSPIATSHRLMSESLELVRTVAATSLRQQRTAEALQKRILEIRSRLVR